MVETKGVGQIVRRGGAGVAGDVAGELLWRVAGRGAAGSQAGLHLGLQIGGAHLVIMEFKKVVGKLGHGVSFVIRVLSSSYVTGYNFATNWRNTQHARPVMLNVGGKGAQKGRRLPGGVACELPKIALGG